MDIDPNVFKSGSTKPLNVTILSLHCDKYR